MTKDMLTTIYTIKGGGQKIKSLVETGRPVIYEIAEKEVPDGVSGTNYHSNDIWQTSLERLQEIAEEWAGSEVELIESDGFVEGRPERDENRVILDEYTGYLRTHAEYINKSACARYLGVSVGMLNDIIAGRIVSYNTETKFAIKHVEKLKDYFNMMKINVNQ